MRGQMLAGLVGTALLALACGEAEPDTTSETTADESSSSDAPEPAASEPSMPGASCELEQSSAHPRVSIRGFICGETVDYSSLAGRSMHFGRATSDDPETEIRVISVKDDPQHGGVTDETYFEEFGFVLNLAFVTGPEVVNGVSTHSLSSGLFAACDFGTLVFTEAPVTIEVENVEQGARQGQARLTLTGLVVRGFSERYSLDAVPQCGGEVDIVLEGPFVHR